jgi:wyosine [tRNA(Phe)-imidazoG37] synthetase (radical SAM superfamily)
MIDEMIVFGPIPSRRLGRSLGINNIPPKTCSYSCVYCQAGRTNCMTLKRKEFFSTENIYKEVAVKIKQLQKNNEQIDYITFVPDGEPTLDINLGNTIARLKEFEIKIAVITNSSLLWDDDVRKNLMKADLISLKIDSVFPYLWSKINRPHGELKLKDITNGILNFSRSYSGTLLTETMLVEGINDSVESLYKTAEFIKIIQPQKAFLLVPTRPPAEESVSAPELKMKNTAFQIFNSIIENTCLLDYNEGVNFSFTSEAEKELLSILSVHPMRQDAVKEFLVKSNSSWDLIETLISEDILRTEEYSGKTFFVKNN